LAFLQIGAARYHAVVKVLKWLIILALVIPAVGLLAFGPRADESLPPNRVVVDYWEKWTGNEEMQMRQIVKEFNDTVGAQKGIYVRYVSTTSVNQKTLVATAAGVPPDVAGLWDNNMVQFAELDALEPLEGLSSEHGITQSTYKKVYWDACNYNGHLYALISTPAAVALHYNKDAFADNANQLRAAGLDPTRPPKTITELDAYAKVFDRVGPDGQIIHAGYLPMEPGWYVNYTYYWFGGDIWDATNHKFTFTSPRVIQAMHWIESYSKKLGADASSNFQSGLGNFDSPQNGFLAGTVMMEQQGPWMANYILNLKPQFSGVTKESDDDPEQPLQVRRDRMHWAVAPFPSAVPGMENVAFCGFDTLVIPRGAKHKREAFEFIAYVNRQEVMEKLCDMHSKNSPLRAVSQHFLQHSKNPYIDVFETLASSPNAHAVPQVPILPEVLDQLNNQIQSIVKLHVTPEAAMQFLQDHLQQRYDTFMEKQRARRGQTAAN
jgi:multiple sugar transport system substrate-binding protein